MPHRLYYPAFRRFRQQWTSFAPTDDFVSCVDIALYALNHGLKSAVLYCTSCNRQNIDTTASMQHLILQAPYKSPSYKHQFLSPNATTIMNPLATIAPTIDHGYLYVCEPTSNTKCEPTSNTKWENTCGEFSDVFQKPGSPVERPTKHCIDLIDES